MVVLRLRYFFVVAALVVVLWGAFFPVAILGNDGWEAVSSLCGVPLATIAAKFIPCRVD